MKFPRINPIFVHMDNSSQNFKITGDIGFSTQLIKEREMEESTDAIVITFGFPGHRKGAWVSLQ